MCSALIAVKLLCKKPGLKDNNFQALGHKITALGIIAKVPVTTASQFLNFLPNILRFLVPVVTYEGLFGKKFV